MRILVGYASKYGATVGIATAVGEVLAQAGHEVMVLPFDEASDLTGYDAFVLGSGVYAGRWLKGGVRFVEKNATLLRSRPVWLFSSGPIGSPPLPAGEPAGVEALRKAIEPRDHRTFAGKMEKSSLNVVERGLASLLHAQYGDYRDWPAVREWAAGIAEQLRAVTPATAR